MKKTSFLSIAAVIFFAACNSSATTQDTTQDTTTFTAGPAKDTAKKDFSNVVFASKKDTSCGMPLSAGVEDTLHFDGKVYGFCSKSCKDAFIEKLKAEKKL